MIQVVNMVPKSNSDEVFQDSEPHLAVNPTNPQQIAASAFTPDPLRGPNAPIYLSTNGGLTWRLNSIVPSGAGQFFPTGDITTAAPGRRNDDDNGNDNGNDDGNDDDNGNGRRLYAGILKTPGGLLFNALRTPDFISPTVMTVLLSRSNEDQPWTQVIKVRSGPDAGKDNLYIGINDLNRRAENGGDGRTATVEQSLDAAITAPTFNSVRLEKRNTLGPGGGPDQDGPQIRPVVHRDGTVYAVFYGWRNRDFSNRITSDVVVVRDDNRGASATPYAALVDANDGIAGVRVVQNITFTFNSSLGQTRLGGNPSIAVDPRNSSTVYLAWADAQTSVSTLHIRRSTDRGQTWSSDLRTIDNATNPALAVNSRGKVGLLYQRLTGTAPNQRWETHLERSSNGGAAWGDSVLANTPAATPVPTFQPYLGDYDYLMAVGRTFYGIFSANNSPNRANFPNGVRYQRNVDFDTNRLLGLDGSTIIPTSIDPFFVKST
jgi:hypothetical protein